jgi:hypothetical protein
LSQAGKRLTKGIAGLDKTPSFVLKPQVDVAVIALGVYH